MGGATLRALSVMEDKISATVYLESLSEVASLLVAAAAARFNLCLYMIPTIITISC